MRDLCKSHNLVVGPDGKCVLCKRATSPPIPLVSDETEALISKIFTWILCACLVGAGASLVYVWRLDPGYQGARYVGAPSDGAARDTPSSPTGTPALAAQARATAQRANGERETPAQKPNAAGAQKPKSADTKRAAAQPAGAKPTEPVDVVMYSAPWCSICDRSRDYLLARNVTLTERDIDRDQAAARKLKKIDPSLPLPSFEIGGKSFVGFNPWQLEDAIREASLQRYSARTPPLRRKL